MNEGQYDSKNVEHISIENIEVVSNGMDWKTALSSDSASRNPAKK